MKGRAAGKALPGQGEPGGRFEVGRPQAGRRALLAGACALFAAPAAFGCGEDDALEQPKPLAGERVEYPVELWDQDVEGTVLIRVLVGVEGRADSVEVARSSGHEALDSAAASGARAMNFEPARRSADGAAQRVWISLPVMFSKTPPSD